jgi:uncharacterized protein YbjT (DUF2867 family)
MSQHDAIRRQPSPPKVFVTGGTGYLGRRVVRALLEMGARVTVLVRPESPLHTKLGHLIQDVGFVTGDAWKLGSLAGHARGHFCVVHLVGGRSTDPARGLTNRRLNYTSTRTVASMAMADGVQRFVYISNAGLPPWASEFSDSKHMAEEHLRRCGLDWLIVRAPRLVGGERRHTLLSFLMKPLRDVPLLDRLAPLPVGIAARGIARLALDPQAYRQIHYGPDLRRLGPPPPKPPQAPPPRPLH